MKAGSQPAVLEPNPISAASGAYPLTALTYAAITPLSLDTAARSDYAAFLEYAAGPGQAPGLERGELPTGYAPLPSDLRTEAATAASRVRTMVAESTTTTTTTTTTPVATVSPPQSNPAPAPRTTVRNATSVTQAIAPETVTTSTEVVDTTPPPNSTIVIVDEADVPASASPTVLTPFVDLARSRFAVPGIGALALGSALGVMEISKRPRRRHSAASGDLEIMEPEA